MKTYTNEQSSVQTENELTDKQLKSLVDAMKFSFGEIEEFKVKETEQVGTRQYVWTRSVQYKK